MWEELKKFGICVDDDQEYVDDSIILRGRSSRRMAPCPSCGSDSSRVHSHYVRRLSDLSADGRRVILLLTVRKFRCVNPDCSRRLFAERFPGIVLPHRRATTRLEALWTRLGLYLGGEGGARLAREMRITTSADTILRLVHRLDVPTMRGLRVIGMDEWAWRKGTRYGVILCDHISGRPVDLLAECTKEAVMECLKDHPALEVISRDRSGLLADAARQAAPQAIQVADRWHLAKNIGDLVDRLLGSAVVTIPAKGGEENPSTSDTIAEATGDEPSGKTAGQLRREGRYRLIQELYSQLRSIRAVAAKMGMSRKTVRKYLQAPACPTRRPRPKRAGKLDPYIPHLERRWKEGCRNAAQLYRELVAAGYDGSASLLRQYLGTRRNAERKVIPKSQADLPRRVQLGPRQLRRLFYRDPDALSDDERLQLHALLEQVSNAPEVYAWVQEFRSFLRRGDVEGFHQWLERSGQSSIRSIRRFAAHMRRDLDAVIAAIRLPWSNGRVEGHIHRLKLLKRQMYGRAGIELLRRRFLLT